MHNSKKKALLASCGLLAVHNLSANVIFPFMVVLSGIVSVFGWSIIALSLIVEFLVLYFLFDQRIVRVVLATIAMNAASAFFGSGLMLIYDLLFEGILGIFHRSLVTRATLQEIIYFLGFYAGIVFINTLIETATGWFFFGKQRTKKLFLAVLIANAITAAIGLIGLGLYITLYGFPHIRY